VLKPLCYDDLAIIRSWRNEEKVRQAMLTDHVISEQEHLAWWESLQDNNTQKWFVFSHQGVKAGVVSFSDLDKTKISWGFYLANDISPQKKQIEIWKSLEQQVIDYAFKQLNARQLIAQVFEFNKSVIKMHQRFGFKIIEKQQREKNGKSEMVIVMALSTFKET